jgi:hypothetical protein
VSWYNRSIPAFANKIPVTPPTVNKKINPIENIKGVLKFKVPPHIVASQLNIFIAVGIAIIRII